MMKVRQILGSARTMTQIIGSVALLFAGVSLQGCGQKGPLYMPAKLQPPLAADAASEAERPATTPRETAPQR